TSCGCDQSNGETRQTRRDIRRPSLALPLRTERRQRVDGGAADAELEVEMRPRRVSRRADEADPLARRHLLAQADVDAREVRVHRADSVAVRDRDEEPPAAGPEPGPDDATRAGGRDRGPSRRDQVDPGVEAVAARPEGVADANDAERP